MACLDTGVNNQGFGGLPLRFKTAADVIVAM